MRKLVVCIVLLLFFFPFAAADTPAPYWVTRNVSCVYDGNLSVELYAANPSPVFLRNMTVRVKDARERVVAVAYPTVGWESGEVSQASFIIREVPPIEDEYTLMVEFGNGFTTSHTCNRETMQPAYVRDQWKDWSAVVQAAERQSPDRRRTPWKQVLIGIGVLAAAVLAIRRQRGR